MFKYEETYLQYKQMPQFKPLLDILERLEGLEKQLDGVMRDVQGIMVIVQLQLPEGEKDETFLLQRSSD